jgi:tRNA(adenine34) deaminase
MTDADYMKLALAEARTAAANGEVPIGAVIVFENEIVARAGNATISACDPTAHAEIVVVRAAARALGNHRLLGCTLYVTVEPCAMCAGAILQARIAKLVYGCDDAKAGAVRSCFSVFEHPALNHRVEASGGVLAEESIEILQSFFAARR